jgi:hypothetical protein
VDTGSDGGADAGERAVARCVLREGRGLPGGADAQFWGMACELGRHDGVGGHGHDAGGSALRHGAKRFETHAGVQHSEPNLLHDYGHWDWRGASIRR